MLMDLFFCLMVCRASSSVSVAGELIGELSDQSMKPTDLDKHVLHACYIATGSSKSSL
jgi:hypothetical protein